MHGGKQDQIFPFSIPACLSTAKKVTLGKSLLQWNGNTMDLFALWLK